MIWVAWRQFRTQALLTLVPLCAVAALLLVRGVQLHELYESLGGARCAASRDCTLLADHYRPWQALVGPALLALPALLGMFWGAPLLARELESGTYRLAWTQSITRRRWLAIRVAVVGVSTLVVAGFASWLVSWWFGPLDAVSLDRMDPSVFTVRGVVAIGYAGFALALGVAAGALLRRTLPAMAATLLGFAAARVAFTVWVRPHLLPARHMLVPATAGKGVELIPSAAGAFAAAAPPPIPNVWTTSAALVDRAHHVLDGAQLHALTARVCPTLAASGPNGPAAGLAKGAPRPVEANVLRCQQALSHHLRQLVSYQPSSHYWPLQALETGIFLAAALALVGATVWHVGRRATRAPESHGTPPPLKGGPAPVVDLAGLRASD